MMKVVVMAGGKGERISSLFPDIPKPLIPIEGIATLEREIIELSKQGFNDFIFTVSYKHEEIINHFKDGSKYNIHIDYFIEEKPMGNAGALFFLDLDEDFILINGDLVFDIDLNRMINFHNKYNLSATIFTHPSTHPYDSSLIIAKDNVVTKWISKDEERPIYYKNQTNAGIHILSSKIFKNININKQEIIDGRKIDLDKDILKPLSLKGELACYKSSEYVKDMGTKDRYYAVIDDYKKGIISNKNLLNKQKAIFLDRDGTINEYVGYLKNEADFKLLPKVSEAIKLINQSGYLAIVITNQPVIARGDISIDDLNNIHNKMETLLGENGAYLDAIYYCPHHPDKGYPNEIKELKIDCDCRKPKPGLLLKAAFDFNIDLENSYMIGDSDIDLKTGENAHCHSILTNGYDLFDIISKII